MILTAASCELSYQSIQKFNSVQFKSSINLYIVTYYYNATYRQISIRNE